MFGHLAQLVLLFVFFLLVVVEELALAVLYAVFKLAFVLGAIWVEQFSLTVRFIVLPLPVVLYSFVLVNLQSPAFFFAVDPFSSIEIAVGVKHGAVTVGYSIKLFSFIAIFFDLFRVLCSAGASFEKGVVLWFLGWLLGNDFCLSWDWEYDFAVMRTVFVFGSAAKFKDAPHSSWLIFFFNYLKQYVKQRFELS